MLDIIKIYQKTSEQRCFDSVHAHSYKCIASKIKAEANLIVSAFIILLI